MTDPITIRHSTDADREPAGEVAWLLQVRAEQERAMRAPGARVGRLTSVRHRAAAFA